MLVIHMSPSNARQMVIAFPFSIYATVHRTVRTDMTRMQDYAQQVIWENFDIFASLRALEIYLRGFDPLFSSQTAARR